MKVKTESEMIEAAMRIANEGATTVLFVVPDRQQATLIWKTILDNLSLWQGAQADSEYLEYRTQSGGLLRVMWLESNYTADWGGIVATHIFARYLDRGRKEFLQSRIRSNTSNDFSSPMGLYDNMWVEVKRYLPY